MSVSARFYDKAARGAMGVLFAGFLLLPCTGLAAGKTRLAEDSPRSRVEAGAESRRAGGFNSFRDIAANIRHQAIPFCYGDTSSLSVESDAALLSLNCGNRVRVTGGKKGEFIRADLELNVEPSGGAAEMAVEIIYDLLHAIVRDKSDKVYSMDTLSRMVSIPMAETISRNLYLSEKVFSVGELKIRSDYCLDSVEKRRGKTLKMTLMPRKP